MMLTGKRFVFILMLSFLTAAYYSAPLGAQEASDTPAVPRIAIDAAEYNAGEVYEGETVSHSFKLKNTGTGELTIKDVRAG